MYKIILRYDKQPILDRQIVISTYFNLEYCREQLKVLKDRISSMGCRILELKIYKVEEIQDPDQI